MAKAAPDLSNLDVFAPSDKIVINIRGRNFSGILTDSDGIFFIAMMAPDVEMILGHSKTITFSEALQAIYDEMGETETSEDKRSRWVDRLQQRVIISPQYREAFCQRAVEMFPDLNRSGLIFHQIRTLESGENSPTWGIRIEATEVLSDIIIPCLELFMSEEYRELINKRHKEANARIDVLSAKMAKSKARLDLEQDKKDSPRKTADAEPENIWDEDGPDDEDVELKKMIKAAGGRDALKAKLEE